MMQALIYQQKKTAIHRLSPAVKLAWGGSLVVLSLLFDHPLYIALLLIAVVLMVRLAGVWREWRPTLKLGLWLGVCVIIINALVSYQGEHVLAAVPFSLPILGRPEITLEAIAFGGMMALKLLVIISVFAFINLVVHPDDIMSVMLKMRLPYRSVLVTSLSTRFIPCLIEDALRISDAYRTRGVMLDTGGWLIKLKRRAGIIIPLLSNSLDRAVQVAEAMEARAFGTGRKRVFYRDIQMLRLDVATLGIAIAPLVTGITLRIMKYGSYSFYPVLEKVNLALPEWVLLAVLGFVIFAVIPLAFLKRRMALD
jgi:energy-coupling factor transport system permease protein